MKVAYWGLALIVLGIVGVLLIDLFGNITVTNQLNYTTMKNAVESSMLDAVDQRYLSGFCLCTDKEPEVGQTVNTFNNKREYELVDVTYEDGNMKCVSNKRKCDLLQGERRINKDVFKESFVRRFAEMVNNNKDYRIVFQEIIEYPPKVSILVSSKDDEFLATDKADGYEIVNQIDAVLETYDDLPIVVLNTPGDEINPIKTNDPGIINTPIPKKYHYDGSHVTCQVEDHKTETILLPTSDLFSTCQEAVMRCHNMAHEMCSRNKKEYMNDDCHCGYRN